MSNQRPLTTAQRVEELGRELARFDTSLMREIEIGQEITRLIEAEPNNRELDEWRAVLAMR